MIPDFGPTYDEEAVFSPTDSVAGDVTAPELPPAVVLGFHDGLGEAARERGEPLAADLETPFEYVALSSQVGYVPVQDLGVGSPAAAIATETVIARDATVVVVLGSAAALQPVDPGAALLPTRAIRDEGASHHYVPPDEPVTATAALVDELEAALCQTGDHDTGDHNTADHGTDDHDASDHDANGHDAIDHDANDHDAGVETHRGPVWTTSALFRETVPQVEYYSEAGVVSVDMETAAVWAVCRYRGADAATVHAVGSYLSQEDDRPVGTQPSGGDRLAELLDPTVRALESYVSRQA